MKPYLRKRKIFRFFFLGGKFLFFNNFQLFLWDFSSPDENKSHRDNKKIHEAPASTANAPLLNLNLNYEKLQCKGTDI